MAADERPQDSLVDRQPKATRLLFRLVATNPPSERDFLSNHTKGRPPRGPELRRPELHTAVSTFSTMEGAAAQANRPGYVAELTLPTRGDVRVEQTLGPSHYSVWADPELLRSFVTAVHPLELRHG